MARAGFDALCRECERLGTWMTATSFPLWAGAGIHESGASWEALDFDGNPVPDDAVRVRVQARQAYVFSLAHTFGWRPEFARSRVESLLGHLLVGCRRPDGLFGKTYSLGSGRLIDDTYLLYETAFALLALAEASGSLGDGAVRPEIDAILTALDDRAAHADGGYYEQGLEQGRATDVRLQNPHMHLFESFLALAEAGFDDLVGDRAERLYAFVQATFFDASQGIVQEKSPGSAADRATFEPGHSFEWVWLLWWWAERNGQAPSPFAGDLYDRALASLAADGTACMQASVDGGQKDASRRLWAQAEVLKAQLCRAMAAEGTDREAAIARAAETCRGLRENWLEPAVAGGWHDHFDADGKLIAADMPASTGYHLFGAIRFLGQSLARLS